MRKLCVVLFISFSLLACVNNGTPSQSFYYILDGHEVTGEEDLTSNQNRVITGKGNNIKSFVKLLPINLPGYLNQPNLVLKLSNHQIKIAHYHFWAEDLGQSMQRILLKELSQIDESATYTTRCETCDQLAINIDHFYASEQGDVLLSGTYEKLSPQNLSQMVRFSFTQELNAGGYDEAVEVMRNLLSELAKEIGNNAGI